MLRLALVVAQRPGFVASSDTYGYLLAAHDNIFLFAAREDTFPWPAGYPAFLAVLHDIAPYLTFIVVVQHALGIATAVIWFFTVRRVVPAMWALLPAGVMLCAGPVLFLEHAPLSETLFVFLIAAATYCVVRGTQGRSIPWLVLAGLLGASVACVRVIGLPIVALFAVWTFIGVTDSLRRRLIAAAAVALSAGAVFGAYLVTMKLETGGPALARSDPSVADKGVPTGPDPHVGRPVRDRRLRTTRRGRCGGRRADLGPVRRPPAAGRYSPAPTARNAS